MMKMLGVAFVALTALANPALAYGSHCYGGYHAHRLRWQAYVDTVERLPYGWPMIAYRETYAPIGGLPWPAPVDVYYIPQTEPLYNVPPYAVIAPY